MSPISSATSEPPWQDAKIGPWNGFTKGGRAIIRSALPFIDLAAQQARIRDRIEANIRTVLGHGAYLQGPEVFELEAALARFTGAKHCVGCASGTVALQLALMAGGVGPGHAVFVPALSFSATAGVVALLGATPVMVDIDSATFTIDPTGLERAVAAVRDRDASIHPLPLPARATRLVANTAIPVDLFGQTADYTTLLPLAEKLGLSLLEDAAQAFGAEHGGKKACALGCAMAATSFYPSKPLGCYGDGGAVFTDDDGLAMVLRALADHGRGSGGDPRALLGINGRLDTLQAAILLAKLEIFADELDARQVAAARYTERLASIPGIAVPRIAPGRKSSWAQYCIRVADGRRDELAARLRERGIPTKIYYDTPLHMDAAFAKYGYNPGDMPTALTGSRQILAVPFHPYLTEADIDLVAGAVADIIGG